MTVKLSFQFLSIDPLSRLNLINRSLQKPTDLRKANELVATNVVRNHILLANFYEKHMDN